MAIQKMVWLPIPMLIAAALLAGCSATEMVGQWQNPEFRGEAVDSLLVVGHLPDATLRRMYEDHLAAVLQERGIQAVASYLALPEAAELELAEAEKRARALGLEGVLVTRLLDERQVAIPLYGSVRPYGPFGPYPYGSPYYDHRYRFYDPYDYYGYAPAYREEMATATVFLLETNLYAGDAGLVWAARTETTTREPMAEKVEELAKELVEEMAGGGVI